MQDQSISQQSSIELFSGAGGLALATQRAGFHHEGLFEWNKDACRTLVANSRQGSVDGVSSWEGIVNEGDVSCRQFQHYQGIDLVAGGPPCQPFSLGGKHKGMEDRRDMIPQFIRAVREAAPRAFLLENVKGLTRNAFATYLEYSVHQLSYPEIIRSDDQSWEDHLRVLEQHHTSRKKSQGLSYNVLCRVLNAADYGVPQTRERLFIVGIRSDISANWSFPKPTHSRYRLLHEQLESGEYWNRTGRKPTTKRLTWNGCKVTSKTEEHLDLLPWRTLHEAIADLPEPFETNESSEWVFNHRFQPGARPYPGHTGSVLDLPAKTLKAGTHGVPGGENMINFENGYYRYLTIREAARIQTFPDQWRFEGAWSEAMRQLGNAVPVDLAYVVANSLKSIIQG